MNKISGQISFDDPRITHEEYEKTEIKRIFMKKGQVIRIAFLSDLVSARPRHYKQKVGYRKCLAGQGFCPACIAAERNSEFHDPGLKRASESFAANVFVFDTYKSQSDLAAVSDPRKGDIHCFIFGTEKFSSFRSLKQMYGTLVGLDIQITCTDENFQKMNIMAYPREFSVSSDPEWQAWANSLHMYPVEKLIAKEVSPAQMIKDFNLNPAIMDLIEGSVPDDTPMVDMTPPTEQVQSTGTFIPPKVTIQSSKKVESPTPTQPAQAPKVEQFTMPSALDEI